MPAELFSRLRRRGRSFWTPFPQARTSFDRSEQSACQTIRDPDGLAGSGKTQLAMRLGEWSAQTNTDVIATSSYLCGLTGRVRNPSLEYEDALEHPRLAPVWFSEAFEIVLRAANDPRTVLLIIRTDELADVERYSSDFSLGSNRDGRSPDLVLINRLRQWVLRDVEARRLPLPTEPFRSSAQ